MINAGEGFLLMLVNGKVKLKKTMINDLRLAVFNLQGKKMGECMITKNTDVGNCIMQIQKPGIYIYDLKNRVINNVHKLTSYK